MKQTYQNFEIIVIDNNSSDHSKEVVNSFHNPKIRLFDIENNGIISKSRNLGISKSKGEWICFLDADDYWFKNKLLVIKNKLEMNNHIDVICNGEIYFFNKSKKFYKKFYKKKNYKLSFFNSLLLAGNQLSTSATSVNKKFISENKIKFSEDFSIVTSEDYDYWLRLAFKKANFEFIDSCLGIWFLHKDSTSNKYYNHNKAYLNVALFHLDNSRFNKNLKKFLRKYLFFKYYISSLKYNLINKNFFKALKFFMKLVFNFYFIFFLLKIKKK